MFIIGRNGTLKNRQIGNSRNDSRPPKLPKDPEKREKELFIREWAKNNGTSISVAKSHFAMTDDDDSVLA